MSFISKFKKIRATLLGEVNEPTHLVTIDDEGLMSKSLVPVYTIDIVANQLKLYKNEVEIASKDLSIYLDDTNLARIVNGVLNEPTGVVTFTRDDATTFTIDMSALLGGVAGVSERYLTFAALITGQPSQTDKAIYYVSDASGYWGITEGYAYVEYLGTTIGNEEDYKLITNLVSPNYDAINAVNFESQFRNRIEADGGYSESDGNTFINYLDVSTKASLLCVPIAYKEYKLYSAIPTNGFGDGEFIRTTNSFRINNNGVEEELAPNLPLIDYKFIEPLLKMQTNLTNLFLNSSIGASQTINVAGYPYEFSFIGDGTVTFSGSYTGSITGVISGLERNYLRVTPTAGAINISISGDVREVNFGRNINYAATSWVETFGNAVSRGIDALKFKDLDVNGISSSGLFHLFFETGLHKSASAAYGNYVQIQYRNGNYLNFHQSDNSIFLRYNDGNGTVTASGLSALRYENSKIILKVSSSECKLFVNGVIEYQSNPTGFTTSVSDVNFNAQQSLQFLKSIHMYNTPLTDNECINLTTI